MAISPYLTVKYRKTNTNDQSKMKFISKIQALTKKYGGIGDINEKVTFRAKFMPQSPGYIASYQVELAAK